MSTVNYVLFSCSIYIYSVSTLYKTKTRLDISLETSILIIKLYAYQRLLTSIFTSWLMFLFVGILLLNLGKIREIYIYISIYWNCFLLNHYVDIGIDVTRVTRSNTNTWIDIIILYSCHSTYTSILWYFLSNHCTLHF